MSGRGLPQGNRCAPSVACHAGSLPRLPRWRLHPGSKHGAGGRPAAGPSRRACTPRPPAVPSPAHPQWLQQRRPAPRIASKPSLGKWLTCDTGALPLASTLAAWQPGPLPQGRPTPSPVVAQRSTPRAGAANNTRPQRLDLGTGPAGDKPHPECLSRLQRAAGRRCQPTITREGRVQVPGRVIGVSERL